jgi:hypothetical protein
MKIYKFPILFFSSVFFIVFNTCGQANPFIAVLPANSGLVTLGGTLDLTITIGNTGTASIAVSKLRPIIQVPVSVTFLPDAQQTGLPAGWSILSNTGSQLRVCNSGDIIPGQTNRIIILKVQGVSIAPSTQFQGNINFGNGTTCAPGTSVAGDNTADNAAQSTIEVVAGCSLGVSATAGNINCNGGTTTITASTTAASGAVEFSITGAAPYQGSNIFTVPAGTYTISAREVNNPLTCIALTNITVTEPPAITLPLVNITQPTCTVALGIVSVTSSTSGFIFSVDGGPYINYPPAGYSLASGNHFLTAKNNNNCISPTANFVINTQPPTSPAPVIGAVIQPSCSLSTGSVVLTNLPSTAWTINPGNMSGTNTSTTINNLAAGIYNFTITNTSGCTSLPSPPVTINAVLGAPAAPLINVAQPTCVLATGSVIITSSTTGLLYSLDGGPYTPYPIGGFTGISSGTHTLIGQNISGCLTPVTNIIINTQPASPIAPIIIITQPTCTISSGIISITSPTTGLTFSFDGAPFTNYPLGGYITNSGTHSLAVQNLSGCVPNYTNNIIVNPQPATPTIVASSTLINCFGGNSTITASSSGGVSPYQYSINNGVFQTSNIFSVGAGSYQIAVKDFNGCTGNTGTLVITQPGAITASSLATPIECNGGNSTLTISASGGLGAFEYSLNNGPFQASNIFNVAAGSYAIKVRLINNPSCSTSVNTVININQPAKLTATASAKAINYCGGSTVVTVKAEGGKTPYSGIGNFTRGPGKWTFNVVDSNGCSASADVTILPPGCVDLKVFPNPSDNIITVNHSAAINTGASIQIFSTGGVRVITQMVAPNSFISRVNVSMLAGGNYLLVYLNGDEKKETKFIKINK